MPLHLSPISRRGFLKGSAASVAGLTVIPGNWASAADEEGTFVALLSDTHIPSSPTVTARDVNMTGNLRRVVAELTALTRRPAAVIVNGDCAYLKGLPEDYANFAECVAPLGAARLPLHLTMGNHDNRGPLYEALAAQRPDNPPVESKHVSVLELPHANWFLLDTLFEVNVVTGDVGAAQLAWLGQALDSRRDKPAIVMAHHTPQFEPPAEGKQWGGMRDTSELFRVMQERPHVKAFVYGHSHDWKISKHNGLNLINLPPVAYVFGAGKPNGWVEANVQSAGLRLKLHTLDPNHPDSGQQVVIDWT